jgi:hypothetical protein
LKAGKKEREERRKKRKEKKLTVKTPRHQTLFVTRNPAACPS